MKRAISFLLAVIMCMSLVGCGKSKAAKEAEAAIDAIGEVTLDSGEAIAYAEKLYGILTDDEKADVENRLTLVDAKEAYAELQGKVIYDNALKSYEKLNEVAALCVDGMDDIYGAWYFGIYEADDAKYSFYSKFAAETPHITKEELENSAKIMGYSESSVRNSWQNCVTVAQGAIILRGDYDTITEKMAEAENILQELTNSYDDYTYYPRLKEYYAAVSSYVEFFTSPTGSFNQLADTVNNFENTIRTYQSDVGFLFTK